MDMYICVNDGCIVEPYCWACKCNSVISKYNILEDRLKRAEELLVWAKTTSDHSELEDDIDKYFEEGK